MPERMIQLVVQYDGTDFSGWQVQPATRTVQGVLEDVLGRLGENGVRVTGAGRTDAGVHARGQVAGVDVGGHWTPEKLRRALNQQLPGDVWIAESHEMVPSFHARFSATSRRYRYVVGLRDDSWSPFRRRFVFPWPGSKTLDFGALEWCATATLGMHAFRGFAVKGTAPADDDHRCDVRACEWTDEGGDLVFTVEANRFLHHMVRFLVGTMVDVAAGRRVSDEFAALLTASENDKVSAPAPASGLSLERVNYPTDLYIKA